MNWPQAFVATVAIICATVYGIAYLATKYHRK